MTLQGIGLAGCGRMGAGMLAALRRAGFDAKGFDVRPPAGFGTLAPHVTDEPAAFTQGLRTLLTVVRDIAQTDDVLFGAQGFAATPGLERIIVCSTLSPRYVLSLRDRVPARITLIDAPMSGAQIAQLRLFENCLPSMFMNSLAGTS